MSESVSKVSTIIKGPTGPTGDDWTKKVVVKCLNGKWTVTFSVKPGAVPVTMRDVRYIQRLIHVRQRLHVKEHLRLKNQPKPQGV